MQRSDYIKFLAETIHGMYETGHAALRDHVCDYEIDKKRKELEDRMTRQMDILESELTAQTVVHGEESEPPTFSLTEAARDEFKAKLRTS